MPSGFCVFNGLDFLRSVLCYALSDLVAPGLDHGN